MTDIKFSLHCFAGDFTALSIMALSTEIGFPMTIRYLKPNNISEKIYKKSLTKTFPQLHVESKGELIILERTPTILKYIVSESKREDLYPKSIFDRSIIDSHMDILYQEMCPPLFIFKTYKEGHIELEEDDLQRIRTSINSVKIIIANVRSSIAGKLILTDFMLIPLLSLYNQLAKEEKMDVETDFLNQRTEFLNSNTKKVFRSPINY